MALMLSDPPVPADWIPQTPLSDPGEFAALFDALDPSPAAVAAVARNLIAHYRAEAEQLPASSRGDVDLRWVSAMLAVDQGRHPGLPLSAERPVGQRLQGNCRDHSLLSVGILRHHGVPARTRVGFADYVVEGWHHDHVVVEMHDGARWRRVDTELAPDTGTLDPDSYGGGPVSSPALRGESFVLSEVFWELAHRYGDELLLWDGWGAIPPPGQRPDEELLVLLDEVAAQLIAADAGDMEAERALHELYLQEARLRPGAVVLQLSPVGHGPVRVDLSAGPQGV